MRIAVIAHIRHAIAPPFRGGMESHCASLVQGLRARGHEVTLFAAGGSDPALKPVAICDRPYEATLPWDIWRGTEELRQFQLAAFERAWDRVEAGGFDVVHNNTLSPELVDMAACGVTPTVTSQHVPPFAALREAVARTMTRGSAHCCFTVASRSQLPLWDATDEGAYSTSFDVVWNGIDTATWLPSAHRHDRFVWFGRITPNKGTAQAVAAAVRAGVRLDLAGVIEDRSYFDAEVAPFLGERIRYLGHLCGEELTRFVASSRAVIVTPRWEEPFGLVAAEALSCDVPVIAFDRGALHEVVGDCGRIVADGDVRELAQALARPPRPERGRCRGRAQERFSIDAMLEGYERCYARAIAGTESIGADASSAASTRAELA